MLEEQETNGLARAAHGRTKPERFVVRRTKAVAHCTRQKIIDAAREVFHRHGVGRSTLEQIAQVAGLTRGAVYWHFKGKAELFLEVRKDVFAPLIENVDLTLCSERYTDPLDAIEASLKVIYCTLENSSTVRQVYEIMLLRCEHVDEFSEVLLEVSRPAIDFLEKMTIAYKKARAIGILGQNLDPIAAAQDTHAFVFGLLHLALAGGFTQEFRSQALAMISGHIALRRQR